MLDSLARAQTQNNSDASDPEESDNDEEGGNTKKEQFNDQYAEKLRLRLLKSLGSSDKSTPTLSTSPQATAFQIVRGGIN